MINFPLKEIRSYLSTVPVDRAWLFGSFARGEETENSDIDLLVQFTQGAKLGWQYFHIINDLESLAKRRVDLVELSTLDPFVAPFVNNERILIYERTA
ncbi:MAG: nucleotidyltransferase domain-containing protein [Muribaculaceae bacterium]|nr:nucleotidyltransferase domain-containing protein [Muribaculaceae bacterium]